MTCYVAFFCEGFPVPSPRNNIGRLDTWSLSHFNWNHCLDGVPDAPTSSCIRCVGLQFPLVVERLEKIFVLVEVIPHGVRSRVHNQSFRIVVKRIPSQDE